MLLLKKVSLSSVFIVCFIVLSANYCLCFECKGNTYNDLSLVEPVSTFSPHDKIYLKIACKQLPPGTYIIRANWTHITGGIIRSDGKRFTVTHHEDRMVYFWIKLLKQGMVLRMLNGNDFDGTLSGQWSVLSYMNNDFLFSNNFKMLAK